MSKLKTILSLVLIFCVLRCECARINFGDVDIEAGKGAFEKIKDGLSKLKENTIFKNVVTAGKVIGHTAVAIKNIVALIKGPGESEELKFMKEEFAKINTKLDALEYEFQDIKNQIDWTTMKVNVGEYERIIKGLEVTQADYMKAPPAIAHIYSQRFIQTYERTYQDAALKLYNALASDGIFQENIIAVARRQFEERHVSIAHFVSYILLIIERGVILENTYYAMKGDAKAESRLKTEWESRFKRLETVAANFDKEIINAWSYQYKIDSKKFADKRPNLKNHEMARELFLFLRAKYPWRYFTVLVYTFTNNNPKDRMFDHCGGWSSGNIGNKVIIVKSMTPEESKVPKSDPKRFFQNLQTRFGYKPQVAKLLFDKMPHGCHLYYFLGVFETKSNPITWANVKMHSKTILITRKFSPPKYYTILVSV